MQNLRRKNLPSWKEKLGKENRSWVNGKKTFQSKEKEKRKIGKENKYQMPVKRRLTGSRDLVALRSSCLGLGKKNLIFQK